MEPQSEAPYMSSFCGKGFKHKYDLSRHVVGLHKGEGIYTCTVCEKSFEKRSHLSTHMKIHSEETLHTCFTCGISFKRKTHLKKHLTIHAADKHNSKFSSHIRTLERQVLVKCNASEVTVSTTVVDLAEKEGLSTQNPSHSSKLHTQEEPFIIAIKVEEM